MSGKGKDWTAEESEDDEIDEPEVEATGSKLEKLVRTEAPSTSGATSGRSRDEVGRQRLDNRVGASGSGGGEGGRRPESGTERLALYVENLSYETTADTLGNFFVDGGCRVSGVNIQKNNGRSTGRGRVIFADSESVRLGLTAHGQIIDGRRIAVKSGDLRDKGQPHGRNFEGNRSRPDYDTGHRQRHDGVGSENAADADKSWDRGLTKKETGGPKKDKPLSGKKDSNDPGPSLSSALAPPPPPPAASRPVVKIAPRTLPVEEIGKVTAQKESIFGGAKPNDIIAWEVCKVVFCAFCYSQDTQYIHSICTPHTLTHSRAPSRP